MSSSATSLLPKYPINVCSDLLAIRPTSPVSSNHSLSPFFLMLFVEAETLTLLATTSFHRLIQHGQERITSLPFPFTSTIFILYLLCCIHLRIHNRVIISDGVVIPNGVTLTILPGTSIQFMSPTGNVS